MKVSEICKYAPKSNIKAGDACDGGEYMFFTSSADESKRYNDYQNEGEGIIMGTGGNATLHYYDGKYAVSTDCVVLLPDEQIRCKYLYYFFLGNMRVLEEGFKGAGLKHTNKGYIGGIDIGDIPSFDKQDKIIEIFDTLRRIIDLRTNEIEKLDELIKARFVELFGLPVTNSKGWKTEKMNEVAPAVNYNGEFDDKVWLLNLDMVESQTGKILDYLIVSEEDVGNSTCTFDTSNVLYSKLRPYLNKVVIPDRCGYATSELVPLQPVKAKINREYIAFMLRSDEFVNMINEKVAGAKMPRVSMGDFRKFDVPVPPMELQNQFADFVHQVDKSKFIHINIILDSVKFHMKK